MDSQRYICTLCSTLSQDDACARALIEVSSPHTQESIIPSVLKRNLSSLKHNYGIGYHFALTQTIFSFISRHHVSDMAVTSLKWSSVLFMEVYFSDPSSSRHWWCHGVILVVGVHAQGARQFGTLDLERFECEIQGEIG